MGASVPAEPEVRSRISTVAVPVSAPAFRAICWRSMTTSSALPQGADSRQSASYATVPR
ncbi:hypothetical protein ACFCZ2_10225 [Streptomyces sp. NPDC056202]|uniref:hypothetical protein n=1 Tax=Streptomyces sp. NPDC056202 TaxID=3345745 RepID=UPI0035E13779